MPKVDKGLKIGDVIPTFTLPSVEGSVYTQDDLVGKITLLYFMRGTW